MKKLSIAFGIHNHQPVGNFDFVFEDAYQRAYLPFLEALERHPKVRLAQHYTGVLFDWLKEHKPEFLRRLRRLVASGQIEMMTGGFYEPILSVIPDADKLGQIRKLTEFVREHTGYEASGMWLAERIWEPHLAKFIHEAGVQYVVLDDAHFKNAGLEEAALRGYYVTEEQGAPVYLFPISERLRYAIPFRPPEETLDFLRSLATEDGQALIVFADDGEKFGVWPNTYEHCYEQGWLDRFFTALEENSDWLEIVHFSEVLQKIKPLGRIYLPTASYREMMEWALPTRAIHAYEEFEAFLKREDLHEKYKVFVRGGFWRNFLAKYPESNNMHKKMLHLSARLAALQPAHGDTPSWQAARDHIWAGQCNCPYWHGIFGGLYLNHLRFATYRQFILAERLLDQLERSNAEREQGWTHHEVLDFDCDGREELLIRTDQINVYVAPERGGTLFEWDLKDPAINLLDTLTRREEGYHKKLLELKHGPNSASGEGPASIHDFVASKEEGLEEKLFYDTYRRESLVDHFLAPGTNFDQFERCQHEEAGDFVSAPYEYAAKNTSRGVHVELWRNGSVQIDGRSAPVRVRKQLDLAPNAKQIEIRYEIENLDNQPLDLWFGAEFDFALLAGNAPDRYYTISGHTLEERHLASRGETADVNEVCLTDEWLGLRIAIQMQNAACVWRFPIETVSQSEAGFERVYQSSVVLPTWRFQLAPARSWRTEIAIVVQEIKG